MPRTGPLFLGIDVGTQGTKALLLDQDERRVVARASRRYGLIEGLPPGAAEQHPDTWIGALREACAALFAECGDLRARVAGIGVSGQQHGCVVLDGNDRPLRPAKLWCDTSTAAEARELSAELGAHVPAGYTASKVRWLARREPGTWSRARRVLLPHDYVVLRLSGRAVTDAGDASGTGWFDSRARAVDLRACAVIDPELCERLPALLAPDEAAGELTEAGAELTGLSPGVLVSAGSGDNMLSALGSGATRAGVGVISLGTSATLFAHSAEPVIDASGAVAPFCDATGAWLPLLCVMNATGVTEEVRRAFGGTHAELAAAALRVPAGCRGVTWLPYLQGERVPDLPDARGVLAGLGPGSLEPALLYRAAIEGVAHNLALGLARFRELGPPIESARVAGGAAESDLWCRILADVLELPLARLAEKESAALGAALQAWWCWSRARGERTSADELAAEIVRVEGAVLEPDPGTRAAYAEGGARFRALLERECGVR